MNGFECVIFMMKASKYSRRSMTCLCDFTRTSTGLSNVLLAFGQKAFHIECSDAFSRKQVHFRRSCNRNAIDVLHQQMVLNFLIALRFGSGPTIQIECHVHFTVSFTFVFHCLDKCVHAESDRSYDLLVDGIRFVFSC